MRLIDADALVEAILDARRSETDTVPKLIVFINNQPTEAWKGLTPTADVMEALQDLARNGSQSKFCKYEPKRGQWIRESEETPYLQGVYKTRCSECGGEPLYISTDEWEDTYRERLTPYCPNCGADMRGGQE